MSDVQKRLQALKEQEKADKPKTEKEKEEEFLKRFKRRQEELKKEDEVAKRRKVEERKKEKLRKKGGKAAAALLAQAEEGKGETAEAEGGIPDEIAKMMGFSGFGTSKK